MNSVDALELTKSAIHLVLAITAPIVVAVMIVGVAVAMLQTLTQIQEMTLTFVPKIIVALLATSVSASFIGNKIFVFTESTYSRIGQGSEDQADAPLPSDRISQTPALGSK